jgi:hypothetical protein
MWYCNLNQHFDRFQKKVANISVSGACTQLVGVNTIQKIKNETTIAAETIYLDLFHQSLLKILLYIPDIFNGSIRSAIVFLRYVVKFNFGKIQSNSFYYSTIIFVVTYTYRSH